MSVRPGSPGAAAAAVAAVGDVAAAAAAAGDGGVSSMQQASGWLRPGWEAERRRIEGLEMLDELEEWKLLQVRVAVWLQRQQQCRIKQQCVPVVRCKKAPSSTALRV